MSVAKVPCTIVTGFLGAGKTTLVRHVLENADGRRLAVIVNEFGDVGIDGEILKSCGVESCPEDAIVELANGCLCCTVADDFVPALKSLLDRPSPPEHIVIETSGLALPKPLVKAFNWPEIASRVTVDGVIAVVDGAAVAAGRFADDPAAIARQRAEDSSLDHDNPLEEVFEDQLLCADLVIMNKADLMSSEQRRSVVDEIGKTLSRAVKVVETENGKVALRVLLGLGAEAEADLANRPSHHDLEGEHDHEDFDTFIVELPVFELAAAPGRPPGEGGRNARHPAHEGLCRHCRQADAPARAGRRRASPASVRSQMAGGAPRPAGGDWREGLRQGRDLGAHPGIAHARPRHRACDAGGGRCRRRPRPVAGRYRRAFLLRQRSFSPCRRLAAGGRSAADDAAGEPQAPEASDVGRSLCRERGRPCAPGHRALPGRARLLALWPGAHRRHRTRARHPVRGPAGRRPRRSAARLGLDSRRRTAGDPRPLLPRGRH